MRVQRLTVLAVVAVAIGFWGCGDDSGGGGGGTDAGADAGNGGSDAALRDAASGDSGADGGLIIPKRPADLTACNNGTSEDRGTVDRLAVPPGGEDEPLSELSGLVASRTNENVLWVHDDSGNDGNIYALRNDGKLLAVYTLQNDEGATIKLLDWEDIAIGPGPTAGQDYLYVGDIGDGDDGARQPLDAVIYRVAEPVVSDSDLYEEGTDSPIGLKGVAALNANYPDDFEYDANALFVDPTSSAASPDIYLITGGNGQTTTNRVFRFTGNPNSTATMQPVANIYGGGPDDYEVTGADMSVDGKWIIVRATTVANIYERKPGVSVGDTLGTRPCAAAIAPAEAATGEGGAVGFVRRAGEATGYYTTHEGKNKDDQPIDTKLYLVPVTP